MDTQNQPNTQESNAFVKKGRQFKEKWQTFREKRPRTALAAKISGSLFLAGILFILSFFLLIRIGAFGKLPSATELKAIQNHTASEVYSSDGKLLGKYFVENRTNVAYEDISPDIINALIATEDVRFFEHKGVDTRAWMRVLIKTVLLSNESAGGGSTLSQQLAKNIYKRKKYKLFSIPINKIKEMYIARRLERAYTKDELLNLYLNTVPFGRNIYGVEVAAKQFFNTNAKDIKTEEAAVLVGMLKANTYYDPVRHPERSKKRRNTVLAQMKKYKYITEEACTNLQKQPLKVEYRRESNNEGLATYFREHIRKQVAEMVKDYTKIDGEPYNLYTDGLKIYTTIDSRMQKYAEEAVTEHLKKLQKDFDKHWENRKPWGEDKVIQKEVEKSSRYKKLKAAGASTADIEKSFQTAIKMTVFDWDGEAEKKMSPLDSIRYYYCMLNAGFLATDPATGNIKAWVGGINHEYFKYDHVKSTRQVGSIFKPLVYAKALQTGIYPCEYFDNRLVTYTDYEDWQPHNSDGKYGGVYSMTGGLSKSVNSIAVSLILNTGIDSVRQLATDMGITSEIPKAPAIALGAVDASLFDMVKVYSTFANRGVYNTPAYLMKIEDADGETLIDFEAERDEAQRILSINHADVMTKMMEAVVDSGTARRLRFHYGLENDIAGKTGTTQSHADGWFMGYTPKLAGGAWVGGESPRIHFRSIRLGQGANTALPIWGRFMQKVYKDRAFASWKKAVFPVPSVEVLDMLNCPPYLEEQPILVEEEFEGDGINAQIDRLLESLSTLKKKKDGDKNINVKPSRRNKAAEKTRKKSEAIKKRNDKRKKKKARKKKRKKFFDKLFGKN